MEDSIVKAKKVAEDLLSFFGLNIDVHATAEDDVIKLDIPSTHMNAFLIGSRGDTMMSLQTIISNILRSQGFENTRVSLDVAEYRAGRQKRLVEEVRSKIEKVRDERTEVALEPMNAADRRAVHKEVGEYSTVTTRSVGEGRDRHIVLKPVDDKESVEEE